jgi:hypothetical protein
LGTFSSTISNLGPNTTYYYRCYAENSAGSDWANSTEQFATVSHFAGSGTEADPYKIQDLEDLRALSEYDVYWDQNFNQTANIDASATSGWNGGDGFSPIGNSSTNFTGSYDGQDHTIANLYINRPTDDEIGLFGYIVSAELTSIGIINIEIHGSGNVGGLTGYAEATGITNSYATGAIFADGYQIGGLIGENFEDTPLSGLYADVDINSGGNDNGTYIGGLIGLNSDGLISNSYAVGAVNGNEAVAGFAGYNDGTISNAYSTGNVTGNTSLGGFAGESWGSENNCFWDKNTSGQTTSDGGTGKTTTEMQLIETYTDTQTEGLTAAWDFVGTENDDSGTNDYWGINYNGQNNGYPFLSWQNYDHVVSQPGLWTGGTSSDWNTASNWDDGNVPTSTINVTIPSGCPNYPSIDESAECQNFTIENGGEININSSFSLEINGDFTLQDGGIFSNNGSLRFSGTDCHLSDNRTNKLTLGNIQVGNNVRNNKKVKKNRSLK